MSFDPGEGDRQGQPGETGYSRSRSGLSSLHNAEANEQPSGSFMNQYNVNGRGISLAIVSLKPSHGFQRPALIFFARDEHNPRSSDYLVEGDGPWPTSSNQLFETHETPSSSNFQVRDEYHSSPDRASLLRNSPPPKVTSVKVLSSEFNDHDLIRSTVFNTDDCEDEVRILHPYAATCDREHIRTRGVGDSEYLHLPYALPVMHTQTLPGSAWR
jgi:hypothetical protein